MAVSLSQRLSSFMGRGGPRVVIRGKFAPGVGYRSLDSQYYVANRLLFKQGFVASLDSDGPFSLEVRSRGRVGGDFVWHSDFADYRDWQSAYWEDLGRTDVSVSRYGEGDASGLRCSVAVTEGDANVLTSGYIAQYEDMLTRSAGSSQGGYGIGTDIVDVDIVVTGEIRALQLNRIVGVGYVNASSGSNYAEVVDASYDWGGWQSAHDAFTAADGGVGNGWRLAGPVLVYDSPHLSDDAIIGANSIVRDP